MTKSNYTFTKNEAQSWPVPNYWDFIALLLVIAIISFLGWGAKAMLGNYQLGQTISISLNPKNLPYYALRTVLRMLVALIFSLLATFSFGAWAAKSRRAERIIIPVIDICQSVPILGFQTVTIVAFIMLFKGSMLGPESAAIFALFTSQAWNMILSFYQSVRSVPLSLKEAGSVFQLSSWQSFWRIDVPYAMPSLIWNSMISMSSGWVFVVATEAISVANQNITLPGIGSYINLAILSSNKMAILYSILAMLIVIALYDQLIFRPLMAWISHFQSTIDEQEEGKESWLLYLFQRTEFFKFMGRFLTLMADHFVNFKLFQRKKNRYQWNYSFRVRRYLGWVGNLILSATVIALLIFLGQYFYQNITWSEAFEAIYVGLITAVRVVVLIIISSIIWVPVGVWIGRNPRLSKIAQPLVQFVAAFPANLLFPPLAILILYYNLNINVWVSPLMILGTQWYILFNVIAGASMMPKRLNYTVDIFQVKGWLRWRRYILPAIFPYYITGAITAAGGAWNISIIAEAVKWGDKTLYATGLGAYIARVAEKGIFPQLVLGISVMVLFVLLMNYAIWKPLYRLAQEKYRIN